LSRQSMPSPSCPLSGKFCKSKQGQQVHHEDTRFTRTTENASGRHCWRTVFLRIAQNPVSYQIRCLNALSTCAEDSCALSCPSHLQADRSISTELRCANRR